MFLKNENPNPPEKNIRMTESKMAAGPYPTTVSPPITGKYWAEGPATLEIGVAGATAALIAQTTAVDIDENDGWFAATPTLAVANTAQYHVIGGGLDIIQTVATADITAGRIVYYCYWKPLSDDGLVVAA